MTKLLQNKYFLWLVYGLIFFLPLERIPTTEISGYTIKISYIIALIIILFIIVYRAWDKLEWFDKENIALLLLWLFAASHLAFSYNRRGLIILALWAFIFIIYLIFSRILKVKEIQKIAVNLIIISSVLVSIFGLFQFFGDSFGLSTDITQLLRPYTKEIMGFPRIQSTALEPLYFANFLLVPIFLLLSKYIRKDGTINIYLGLAFILLLNLGLTISRGAYISIILSLILLLIYLIMSNQLKKVAGVLLLALTTVVCTYLIISNINGSNASKTFQSHSVAMFEEINKDGSSLDRLATFKAALSYFRENPVLGNGLGSFGVRYTTPYQRINGFYATVNNEYLELLSENGLVGLGLFFTFLIFLLLKSVKKYKLSDLNTRNYIVPLFLGLLAIFVQYNFFSTLYIMHIWIFLSLLKANLNFENEKI